MTLPLKAQFEEAAENVKSLAERPDSTTLLNLYAFYKQATEGNVTGERPGLLDFINRAKFDAWEKLKDLPQEEAMRHYIDLVTGLLEKQEE